MSKSLLALVFLLISAFTLAGCLPGNENTDATPTPADETEEFDNGIIEDVTPTEEVEDDSMDLDEGVDPNADTMEVEIVTKDFKFSQDVIEARPGQTITVTLTNQDGMTDSGMEIKHDFVIDELDVATEIIGGVGTTDTVTFTIPADTAPGTEYSYYCSVGQHREMGMEGTLRIV